MRLLNRGFTESVVWPTRLRSQKTLSKRVALKRLRLTREPPVALANGVVRRRLVGESMVSPDTSPDHTEFDPADSRSSSPRTPEAQQVAPSAVPAHTVLAKPTLFLALLKSTYVEWTNDNVTRMSAALAYYTIFSLALLLVIAIAVAGLVFGVQAAQGEISGHDNRPSPERSLAYCRICQPRTVADHYRLVSRGAGPKRRTPSGS